MFTEMNTNYVPGKYPPLAPALRRQLAVQANRLQPRVHIGAKGLTDAIVAQVRQVLRKQALVKIKVHVESSEEAQTIGELLASRVPCHLIQCVGKTLVVYAVQSGSA